MNLEELNKLSKETLTEELIKCCGSHTWANALAKETPFSSKEELMNKSDEIWSNVAKEDILEAFLHHPKIGDIESLSKKFANTKAWAEGEQSGVNSANMEVLEALAKGNKDYEEKFGYIFIVCATGKTASEMLEILQARLPNEPEKELAIASNEQNKITKIRLEKLLQ